MERKFKLALSAVMLSAIMIAPNMSAIATDKQCAEYNNVSALSLVNSPSEYLNKEIKINALFDKFSTLGLDYPKAMKSSEEFISFLIQRPDVSNENNIPLSELKLIINRDKAEDLIELESGDKVEIIGKVFSDALNDPWVEVHEVKVLTTKTAKK